MQPVSSAHALYVSRSYCITLAAQEPEELAGAQLALPLPLLIYRTLCHSLSDTSSHTLARIRTTYRIIPS